MTTLDQFQETAKINFITTPSHADIEIGTMCTTDGYELFYITQDVQNLQFDSEVYYYQPDFDTIMSEIKKAYINSEAVNIMCYDIDDFFDEVLMLDYLESNMDEDSWEEFIKE